MVRVGSPVQFSQFSPPFSLCGAVAMTIRTLTMCIMITTLSPAFCSCSVHFCATAATTIVGPNPDPGATETEGRGVTTPLTGGRKNSSRGLRADRQPLGNASELKGGGWTFDGA